MKFTIHQIKAIHSKVKSGADFPQYIQNLKAIGMAAYTINIVSAKTTYFDIDGNNISAEVLYEQMEFNPTLNLAAFENLLKIHQKGGSDYQTFCKNCVENGIAGWHLDLLKMSCTYFDFNNENVYAEAIPSV